MPARTTRLDDCRSKHPNVSWREREAYTSVCSLHFGEKKDVLVTSRAYCSIGTHLVLRFTNNEQVARDGI